MIVTAREFSSAAEMQAAAAAVRNRCLKPKRFVPDPEPVKAPRLEYRPFFAKQLPAWESGMLTFDAHVVAYRFFSSVASFSISGAARPESSSDLNGRRSIDDIVREVLARYPGVTLALIRSNRRTRDLTEPRQVAMFEVYTQRPDLSLPMIGRYFRRDHTTIIHAVRKIEAMRGEA